MKKLSDESENLKSKILEQFVFQDDASLEILQTGLEARDLYHEAQEQVDMDGLTVSGDRGGCKAHPLLAVIRDQRAQFLAAMKLLLHLDVAGIESQGPGRPSDYDRFKAGKTYQGGPGKFKGLIDGGKR
jgi:hypothetical protein